MEQERTLKNGRRYKIVDTGEPYELQKNQYSAGNTPTGGILLLLWSDHLNDWVYLDNVPDTESVDAFFKAAERLPERKTRKED